MLLFRISNLLPIDHLEEFCCVFINSATAMSKILQFLKHQLIIVVGQKIFCISRLSLSHVEIFGLPKRARVVLLCVHQAAARSRKHIARRGTHLSSGTSMNSRISSMVTNQSSNSSSFVEPLNSGNSILKLYFHDLSSCSSSESELLLVLR